MAVGSSFIVQEVRQWLSHQPSLQQALLWHYRLDRHSMLRIKAKVSVRCVSRQVRQLHLLMDDQPLYDTYLQGLEQVVSMDKSVLHSA